MNQMFQPAIAEVAQGSLVDPFGRSISYLRVSVTDRCDFRCVYCMAEDMTFLPKKNLLTIEELDRVCTVFIGKGVTKLRLTGGEPLVRKGIMTLIESLSRHLKFGSLEELTLTTNGDWKLALDPLHQDRANAGVGLGSCFGRTMADANPRVVVGLITAAVGGTPLSRWVKGGDLYRQALEQAKRAMTKGRLKGILWHQGENDSDVAANADHYAERLTQMIQDLRGELGDPQLPFIAGKLGEFLILDPRADTPLAGTINDQLQSMVGKVPGFRLVESEHLTAMSDRIHFDTPSLREFGRRYAAALLQK